MRKMRRSSWLCLLLGVLLSLSLLAGCSKNGADTGQAAAPAQEAVTQTGKETEGTELVEIQEAEPEETQETEPEEIQGSEPEELQTSETEAPENEQPQAPETEESLQEIDKDGSYTTKEDVALYIHTYGKLPSNFITKKQAEKLGWNGGSLEPYAPGKCIGGGYFGNYEGILPDGNYKECDIDTLGKKKRGAKRLIYSDDGRIYYTDDHYESFTQLY